MKSHPAFWFVLACVLCGEACAAVAPPVTNAAGPIASASVPPDAGKAPQFWSVATAETIMAR